VKLKIKQIRYIGLHSSGILRCIHWYVTTNLCWNITDEWRHQAHKGGSLKSHKFSIVMGIYLLDIVYCCNQRCKIIVNYWLDDDIL